MCRPAVVAEAKGSRPVPGAVPAGTGTGVVDASGVVAPLPAAERGSVSVAAGWPVGVSGRNPVAAGGRSVPGRNGWLMAVGATGVLWLARVLLGAIGGHAPASVPVPKSAGCTHNLPACMPTFSHAPAARAAVSAAATASARRLGVTGASSTARE